MKTVFAILAGLYVANGCQPPNCDNVDLGTCVEACCRLNWDIEGISAKAMSSMLEETLKKGGPDGGYKFWGTLPDQGPLTYVVQGLHVTNAREPTKMHYNDTLNFGVIQKEKADQIQIQAFSHSQDFITANFAYGDHGQNYKNLISILLEFPKLRYNQTHVFGCPDPKN
eukprot:TRINITY_DN956_c7_g1_i2.p1 TRINITY_DN956_c7_g1~~TRINITY_DN956_c7_g1_i2.p1  ORF type:complete len:169 (+),score=29.41 TRINITY_DN956_c7_g1_i2:152-658(+)